MEAARTKRDLHAGLKNMLRAQLISRDGSGCSMVHRAQWLAVVLIAMAIPGCTQAPSSEPGADAHREPAVAGGPVSLPVAHPHDEYPSQRIELQVVPEARSLVVEARWGCDSPTCTFSIRPVRQADGITVATSEPSETDARLVIVAPEPGQYIVRLGSNMFSVGMDGEIRATTFFAFGEPPEDYSAFR